MSRPKINKVRDYLRSLGGRKEQGHRRRNASWANLQPVAGRGEGELVAEVDTYVSTLKNVLVGVRMFRDRLDDEQRHALDAVAQIENTSQWTDEDWQSIRLDYAEAARDFIDALEAKTTGVEVDKDEYVVLEERYELTRRAFVGRPPA